MLDIGPAGKREKLEKLNSAIYIEAARMLNGADYRDRLRFLVGNDTYLRILEIILFICFFDIVCKLGLGFANGNYRLIEPKKVYRSVGIDGHPSVQIRMAKYLNIKGVLITY